MAEEQQVNNGETDEKKTVDSQYQNALPLYEVHGVEVSEAVFWVGLALLVAIAAFVWMAWKFELLRKAIPEFTTG